MNPVVLIVVGVLFGWFLEWLYVYVTRSVPKNNKIKALKMALQEGEQAHSEVIAKMTAEIEALTTQVTELTALNENAVTEAGKLKEELVIIQQTAEANQKQQDSTAKIAGVEMIGETSEHDDMTQLTGVGPKTAVLLNEAGLVSFVQLSSMDAESLIILLQTHNIPHSKAKVMNWPDQAAQLVKDV